MSPSFLLWSVIYLVSPFMKRQLQKENTTAPIDINSLHKDIYKTNGWYTTAAKANYCDKIAN